MEPLRREELELLAQWSNDGGPDFKMQWGGLAKLPYPLTAGDLAPEYDDLIHPGNGAARSFRITQGDGEKLLGAVQLLRIDRIAGEATVGRFLLAPDCRGRGIGGQALRLLCALAFETYGLLKLNLRVVDHNLRAVRCYRGLGFEETGRSAGEYLASDGSAWGGIRMELTKERFEAETSSMD